MRPFVILALLLSSCGTPLPTDLSNEWSRWRGPNGQGVSKDLDLPLVWSENSPNVRWKTRTPGAGNSSPIVSRGRVFLTTAYGSEKDDWDETGEYDQLYRVVLAFDIKSGELLWQTRVFLGPRGMVHYTNTRAAPSPVSDGNHVFVNFDGILAALDFDGTVVWKVDVDPDYYIYSHYGVSTSPILSDESVILMQDREEGDSRDVGWIAAFDKATGAELWRDEWSESCCSYSTPILLDRGKGKIELVSSTSKEIVGRSVKSGERLWTAQHESIQTVPSLVSDGDLLCAPGGVHDRGLTMYRLSGFGKETVAEPLWTTSIAVPKITTPLFYDGRLYVLTENRILTAYDPETGEKIWRGKASPGTYWPSLVAGEGKLYAANQYGVVSVISARPEKFLLVVENSIGDGIRGATPAIAGGCLLLRTTNHLSCVEKLNPNYP